MFLLLKLVYGKMSSNINLHSGLEMSLELHICHITYNSLSVLLLVSNYKLLRTL